MTMTIEVWADLVCPWCYIGKKRLSDALQSTGVEATIVHRAFQLDPSATNSGERTADMLMRKYGVPQAQALAMQQNVTDVAASVGLDYHLDTTISGNTRDAHRLALWAQEQGKGQELLEAMYRAYFTDGKPVFTADELVPVAGSVGIAASDVRSVLESSYGYTDVIEQQQEASALGATGVPFFVIDRKFGIAGAQPLEVFENTLRQAESA